MKKILGIAAALCLLFALSACGGGGEKQKLENVSSAQILVAYFSATGHTAGFAEKIAEASGGTLYEIVPALPYTSSDLNYGSGSSRTSIENNDPNARPEIQGGAEDFEKYDIVFLGYPIWFGKAPKIIYTFLESYDFSGKTIVPFCTSGSSPIGSSATNLHSLTSGATWLGGKRFSASAAQSEAEDWVNSLRN